MPAETFEEACLLLRSELVEVFGKDMVRNKWIRIFFRHFPYVFYRPRDNWWRRIDRVITGFYDMESARDVCSCGRGHDGWESRPAEWDMPAQEQYVWDELSDWELQAVENMQAAGGILAEAHTPAE